MVERYLPMYIDLLYQSIKHFNNDIFAISFHICTVLLAVMTELPSPERLRDIAAKQDEKEQSTIIAQEQATSNERRDAAEKIQRNYRGYRARRVLRGCELTPSQRWVAAVKDAEYRNATNPLPRDRRESAGNPGRTKWRRARAVAEHARGDGLSDSSESEREHHAESNRKRAVSPRSMGLEYFLEMVRVVGVIH